MRGNIDLGLSFTQSNGQQGLTLQSSLAYQSKKYEASLNTSYQFISQQETENTSELTVKSAFFRQLRKSEWYGGAIANFLSSSEQQIALQSAQHLPDASSSPIEQISLPWAGFYFRMSFYDNYDNRPVVGAPSNNLGATSSIGWSFH